MSKNGTEQKSGESLVSIFTLLIAGLSFVGILWGLHIQYSVESAGLNFMNTGESTIYEASQNCAEIPTSLEPYLSERCNELASGDILFLSEETIKSHADTPITQIKLIKEEMGTCTSISFCIYTVNEKLTMQDSVSVCVTRAETNETTCY